MFRLDYECACSYFEEVYETLEECVKVAERYAEEAAYDEYFTIYDENNNVVFTISDVEQDTHLEKIKTWQKREG